MGKGAAAKGAASMLGGLGSGGKGGKGGGGANAGDISAFNFAEEAARLKAMYANLGLGGSTMEAQDLAGAQMGSNIAGAEAASALNAQQASTNATNIGSLSQIAGLANQGQTAAGVQSVTGT